MDYKLVALLSYVIGLPAIIGLIRIKDIPKAYYPFILAIWVGLANEVVSSVVIDHGYSNAINSNIYILVESCLLLCFFFAQGLFQANKKIFFGLLLFYIIAWTYENFLYSSILRFNSYYSGLYSFCTVLMSINLVNRLFGRDRQSMLTHPCFIICMAIILYYTYNVIVEIFWIYGLNKSGSFRRQVYHVMTYINVLVNLLYAAALLWMPKKQKYTLLS